MPPANHLPATRSPPVPPMPAIPPPSPRHRPATRPPTCCSLNCISASVFSSTSTVSSWPCVIMRIGPSPSIAPRMGVRIVPGLHWPDCTCPQHTQQQRYSSVTAALQQRYNSVTAALQQRYSSVTAALQQRRSTPGLSDGWQPNTAAMSSDKTIGVKSGLD